MERQILKGVVPLPPFLQLYDRACRDVRSHFYFFFCGRYPVAYLPDVPCARSTLNCSFASLDLNDRSRTLKLWSCSG